MENMNDLIISDKKLRELVKDTRVNSKHGINYNLIVIRQNVFKKIEDMEENM